MFQILSSFLILPLFLTISNVISKILLYFNIKKSLECSNYIFTITINTLCILITLYNDSSIYPMYILFYYYLWNILYINHIEPNLYSRQLLFQYMLSIWLILWSLNTFSPHTPIMNIGLIYLERPNILLNLSRLIKKFNKFINILYILICIYDRLYNFIHHIYRSIIVYPNVPFNTILITIAITCILTIIFSIQIIEQYKYICKNTYFLIKS
jgi:hypothetical protein